jgi:rRNA processing protein Krr1/Pno1
MSIVKIMMPEEEDGAHKLRHSKKTSAEKIEKHCITTLRMSQVPLRVEVETGRKVSDLLNLVYGILTKNRYLQPTV